uniref:Enzymatic polyprotein n=1 Tax=Cajanus cajan TaxID=3821 RepID=A0A151R2N2_CAJCA|nr:Enzymatic polyprotein [Cajanus cajan]
MKINYKLSSAKICKNKICYETSFVLVKNMNIPCILGTPFLSLLYPFCVNYVADFIPNIRIICAPLYTRLRKNPNPWNNDMTEIVKKVKQIVKRLPCLGILDPEAYLIVETDASDLGYGGILKQKILSKEQIVRYHSGIWHPAQRKYSTKILRPVEAMKILQL